MSAVVSEMLIRIAADTAQLRSQMQQAEQAVGGSLNGIKNVATQARNALIGFFAIDKATELAGAFIKTADAMAQVQARLKLVTADQKELESVQKDVYRISQQNNIGLEEMSQLYAKLHDPVKRLGGTTAETTRITEAFALALRVGGASTTEAASATLQFAQAMASGRLNGDEFRSIAEASPRFMKALADGMNVPIEQLKKMSGEGKLTADVVGNALMKSLSALQQEAQGIPDTVGGAFTRLKNDVAVFLTAVNESTGATGGLASIVGGLADFVKEVARAFKDWGEATKNATGQVSLSTIALKVLGTIFETLIVVGAELAYMVKAIGKSFSDVATLAKAFQERGLDGLSDAYKRVTAENRATKEAHDKFTSSVVGATSRVLQQRDALKNNSLSASENANEMARLVGRHGEVQGATLKSKVANEEAIKVEQKRAEEVRKLMASIEDQTGALMLSEQATTSMSKAEQTALKVMQDLQQGRIKLTDTEKVALAAALELLLNTEKRIAADKELTETKRKVAEHSAKLTEAQWKEVDALREGNVKLMENNDRLRLGEEAVQAREAAVLRSTATDLEWQAANEGGNAALEEQARLLRQRAELLEEGNALQAAKDTADEWKRTAENIEKALTDSLMRGFESGKSMMDSLKSYIVNAFKSFVVKLLVQPIMAGIGGVMGMLGMPGSAMASGMGGGAGGVGSLSNILTGGMNFLNGSTISAGAAGMWTRAGDWMATSSNNTMAGIGEWMQANGQFGKYLGMAGNAFAGYGLGSFANSAISGGYQISSGMTTFQNIGAAVAGAIAGPIGGAIVGAVSGLVNQAFGRRLANQGIYGTFGDDLEGGFEGGTFQYYKGGWFRSNKTTYGAMDPAMDKQLGQGFMAVSDATISLYEAMGGLAQHFDGYTREMRLSLNGLSKEQIAEKLTQEFTNIAEEMSLLALRSLARAETGSNEDSVNDAYLGQYWRGEGESNADMLTRLGVSLQTVNKSLELLGLKLFDVNLASADAASQLVDLFGGIDGLSNATASYYQNFYTEQERLTSYMDDLRGAFEALGVQMPITREGFRQLVEAQDLSTASGRETYAALLQLNEAFAAVVPATMKMVEFQERMTSFGGIFGLIATASTAAQESLVGMAGGIDALIGKAQAFVQEYYSKDEQAGMLARDVVNALQAVGIDTTNLATREDYRALVESRNIENPVEREQLNALLNLSPQFAQVADYIAQNETTLAKLVEAAPQVAILNQILDPTQVTADNTASMASSLEQSNATLANISGQLSSIGTSVDAAVSAAQNAAAAASAAASAATSAAASASLAASAPTYTSNIGG